jgi:hypothetical protein
LLMANKIVAFVRVSICFWLSFHFSEPTYYLNVFEEKTEYC